METLRALSVVTVPAADDDYGAGNLKQCTDKQERFVQAWVKTGNKAAAYRIAYNVHERTLPNVIWVSASRLAALPHIQARFKVLNEQATLETLMSVREALQWQLDIATADPNEVSCVVKRNCRHCRGVGFGYQWRDDIEFLEACTRALDDEADALPDESGGYGFSGALEPIQGCPHCFGEGVPHEIIHDTTKLQGKARKLYAGSEQDRFGVIKVKTHDQAKAWEMACRILGAFNDKLDLRTPEQRAREDAANKLPDNITVDQAGKAYLSLVSS